MDIYTTYIFTINSSAEGKRTSETLKAGKKKTLSKQAGPEATSIRRLGIRLQFGLDKREKGAKKEARASNVTSAVIA